MGVTCWLQRRQKVEGRRGVGHGHRAALALGVCSKGQGGQGAVGRNQRQARTHLGPPGGRGRKLLVKAGPCQNNAGSSVSTHPGNRGRQNTRRSVGLCSPARLHTEPGRCTAQLGCPRLSLLMQATVGRSPVYVPASIQHLSHLALLYPCWAADPCCAALLQHAHAERGTPATAAGGGGRARHGLLLPHCWAVAALGRWERWERARGCAAALAANTRSGSGAVRNGRGQGLSREMQRAFVVGAGSMKGA